jgi:hypothetical protein
MTQAREPDDRGLDRTLRSFVRVASVLPNRRISRLEDTQVTGRELNDAFNRVYDEIDALEAQVNLRFDELKNEMNQRFDSQDAKIDIILRHITGQGNS